MLDTSSFRSQNEPLKLTPIYLGLKINNLEVLTIMDLPGMSTQAC